MRWESPSSNEQRNMNPTFWFGSSKGPWHSYANMTKRPAPCQTSHLVHPSLRQQRVFLNARETGCRTLFGRAYLDQTTRNSKTRYSLLRKGLNAKLMMIYP